jgi:hypothetical protein
VCFNGELSGGMSNNCGDKSAFNTHAHTHTREREREREGDSDMPMTIYIFLLFSKNLCEERLSGNEKEYKWGHKINK